jgi:hypothetical protein
MGCMMHRPWYGTYTNAPEPPPKSAPPSAARVISVVAILHAPVGAPPLFYVLSKSHPTDMTDGQVVQKV